MISTKTLMPILRNQKCIINTDLDGIFSGLILHNFLNWEIVGFCDSDESIWIDKNRVNDLCEVIFIDIFVCPKNIKCIDQHIISVDEEHNGILWENKNKLNPNLINKRNFLPNDSYYKKYPFGTVHFIIAWLERNGIKVDIDLHNPINNNIYVIDLLLRADDAFHTSIFSRYTENAQQWWIWLKDFSNDGKTIKFLSRCINDYKSKSESRSSYKQKIIIADYLQSKPFYCDSPDGGYKGKDSIGFNFLNSNLKTYIKFLAQKSGLKCFNLDFSFSLLRGESKRISLNDNQLNQLKERNFHKDLFSYAFVKSSKKSNSFSYTLLDTNFKRGRLKR